MIKSKIILFMLILVTSGFSQQFTNWQTYTDMKNVEDAIVSGNNLWAATTGGAFVYNSEDNSFLTFHKSEGLVGSSLSALTIDANNKIWFGSKEGIIDVLNTKSSSFNSILDIFNSGNSIKGINQMFSSGDTIFVATDFGLSLIDADNFIFFDTFFKFGNLPSKTEVSTALKFNRIFIGTKNGLAIQKVGTTNLSAPESWEIFQRPTTNIPSNTINKLVVFQNNVIAATTAGLIIFDNNTWNGFLTSFNGKNILDIASAGDTLFILANNQISSFANGVLSTVFSSQNNISRIYYSKDFGLLAWGSNGIEWINKNTTLSPNGPFANQFPSLSVDSKGVLWSASGTDVTGKGFYKFDGNQWTNFNKSNFPAFPTDSYFKVNALNNNTVYFGNWGSGFVSIKDDKTNVFTTQNTGMTGTDKNVNFLVISGFALDSKNNLWVLNYGSATREVLNVLTKDSTWLHFQNPAAGSQYLDQQFNLVIDQYDTKWYASQNSSRPGVFFFNENKTFEDPSDDVSGILTTSDGINTRKINDLVVDKRGDLWIGTSLGVNIISNLNTVPSSGSDKLRITSVFALRQQVINAIAVDALNQKWIGTNQGLLLVSTDGTSLIATLNSKNSPLLTDKILSIAIDENLGRVYVGTDQGLTSFDTPSVKPVASFSELFVYPSPFILNSGPNKLTIDGLIKDSEIKIISISGKLVNEFQSPGGRIATWDGRDLNGNLVTSGVYIIVASDVDGNNVTTQKVAVLRQ